MSAASDMLHTVAVIYEKENPVSTVTKAYERSSIESAIAADLSQEQTGGASENGEEEDNLHKEESEEGEVLHQEEEVITEESSPNKALLFVILPAAALAAGFAIKKLTGRKDKKL